MTQRISSIVWTLAFACVLIPGVAGAFITGITPQPVAATAGVSFTGPVATFVESDASFTPSDYTASINWGDATSSAGTVSGGSGAFTVTGSHVYAAGGPYTITVTVTSTNVYLTSLHGTSEVPPNASVGVGGGSVVLNPAQTQITVDLNFSLLSAAATAAHIHTAPVGVNGPVTFPLTGVPAATSGSLATQTFAITPAQLADLLAGNLYMNVHTSVYPGGEIRGQLTPELALVTLDADVGVPAAVPLLGSVGLAGLMLAVLAIGLMMLRRQG